jgi:amino acid transporter
MPTSDRTSDRVPGASVQTELAANSMGLVGVLMQGIATIAPAFAIVSTFVFTVGLAGVAAPVAYLLAGAILLPLAVSVNQLAKAFPSAGGWYTWIARALHPRAGFFAGWYMTLWLPLAPALVFSYTAKTVLTPAVLSQYGIAIPVWVWTVIGVGFVAWTAYRGVKVSERVLVIMGLTEIAIMIALAISGLASPGPGGFNFKPFNPALVPSGGALFLAVVFSIFAYSGWEATAPLAEESRNPRRNVPLGLLGSVIAMVVFLAFTVWGYLVGIGTDRVASIAAAKEFPVFTLATRVWGSLWILAPLAMLNSALAATAACFNGGTRTWYGMARSGSLPAALGKVHPVRKTPDNAIHLMLGFQLLGGTLMAIFGVEAVFPTWALTLTLGLIVMYVLANIGVVRHYRTEARAEFNVITHLLFPAISTIAVLFVGYKSIVPLPDPPARYAIFFFLIYTAAGGAILLYLKSRGREDWLEKAGLAMAETERGAATEAAPSSTTARVTPARG